MEAVEAVALRLVRHLLRLVRHLPRLVRHLPRLAAVPDPLHPTSLPGMLPELIKPARAPPRRGPPRATPATVCS
jgi:hypothetical protein